LITLQVALITLYLPTVAELINQPTIPPTTIHTHVEINFLKDIESPLLKNN